MRRGFQKLWFPPNYPYWYEAERAFGVKPDNLDIYPFEKGHLIFHQYHCDNCGSSYYFWIPTTVFLSKDDVPPCPVCLPDPIYLTFEQQVELVRKLSLSKAVETMSVAADEALNTGRLSEGRIRNPNDVLEVARLKNEAEEKRRALEETFWGRGGLEIWDLRAELILKGVL